MMKSCMRYRAYMKEKQPLLRISCGRLRKTRKELAKSERIQRLLCLMNSPTLSGQYVLLTAWAEYRSFQPRNIISVHIQRSSPGAGGKELSHLLFKEEEEEEEEAKKKKMMMM